MQFKVERVNCTAIFCSEHTSVEKPTIFPSAQYFFREINGIGSTFYFRQFVLNRKSKSFTGWLTEWEDKIGNRLQLLTQFCVEVWHSSYFFNGELGIQICENQAFLFGFSSLWDWKVFQPCFNLKPIADIFFRYCYRFFWSIWASNHVWIFWK